MKKIVAPTFRACPERSEGSARAELKLRAETPGAELKLSATTPITC